MPPRHAAGQRFHQRRVGSTVAPGVTGMLLTVDPNQTGKAIREMQLYLDRFRHLVPEVAQPVTADSPETQNPASSSAVCSEGASSIAALLAAELDEFRKPVNDDGTAVKKRPRDRRLEPFSILETNCKGYIFINIPQNGESESSDDEDQEEEGEEEEEVSGDAAAVTPRANQQSDDAVSSETSRKRARESLCEGKEEGSIRKPHIFAPNPVVLELIEAMFEELGRHPDRPVVRFTYRLFPCNVSCFPSVGSITDSLRALAASIPPIPGRSAIKLGVLFTVKNNTNVDNQRAHIRGAIESCFPQNRFLVLPVGHRGIELDAMVSVVVVHSTCCIGYAPKYSERRSYNLHDFGK